MKNDLYSIIKPGEFVIYEVKQDKKCYLYKNIFNSVGLFALIWGLLFIFVWSRIMMMGISDFAVSFIINVTMILCLFPTWGFIIYVICIITNYIEIRAIITDKAIYFYSGLFVMRPTRMPWECVTGSRYSKGSYDDKFGTGRVDVSYKDPEINFYLDINLIAIKNALEIWDTVNRLRTECYITCDSKYKDLN